MRQRMLRFLLLLGLGVLCGELITVVFALGVTVLAMGIILALLWAGEVPPKDAY